MMRIIYLAIILSLNLIKVNAQEKRIRIAVVSDLDTTLSIVSSSNERRFDMSFNKDWRNHFGNYLNSDKYQVELVELPINLRGLKSFTNGFSKMNSKYSDFFRELYSDLKYDYIIFLGNARLFGASVLNKYSSYGVIVKKKYVFSLSRIIIVNPVDNKILRDVNLNFEDEYEQFFESDNLKDKKLESIERADLDDVAIAISFLNGKRALKVSKIIYNFSKF